MHKRKSLDGQYANRLRRKQAADRQINLRTRWINFWGDRRERLEAQRQGLGWGEKMDQTRRMLARARERVPRWRAEYEAEESQVDAWIESLEEAQAAEWMQERVVDELEERLLAEESQLMVWMEEKGGAPACPVCGGTLELCHGEEIGEEYVCDCGDDGCASDGSGLRWCCTQCDANVSPACCASLLLEDEGPAAVAAGASSVVVTPILTVPTH
eukprot:SAG11_NODE_595_length_8300_cov_38.415437_1_plen_214_part_00